MTADQRELTVQLGGDRVAPVWDGGDSEGWPVLLHHGTPSGRLQAALADEAARQCHVRLVCFNRPGYGAATVSPPSLATVGRDSLVVVDALGISEFGVLGVSGGGPYAVATGLAAPDRVSAVGLAAGIGPWRLIEPPEAEPDERALLAKADEGDVAGALDGYRRHAHVAFDRMLRLADEAMVTEFFRGAPPDDLRWLDSTARRLWAADSRDALASYDGYARDNVSWGAAWDIEPADLRVPAWLWYGEDDQVVPLEHGRWFADRMRSARLIVRSGAGHGSTIFEFFDDMFETLRSAVRR